MVMTRQLWRTKYPWILVMYIFAFGVFIGLMKMNLQTNTGLISADLVNFYMNLLMMLIFTSYVFLFIFYIYGVRPLELEHHFRRR
ncbi:MAG: hypothetical protein ACMXYF_05955 [Candidatus Woesearchaeota archaeon]